VGRVIGPVVTLALADSLNLSTIAPALYLAAGERAPSRVLGFTTAVLLVQFSGGVIVLLGPGRLLLSVLPQITPGAKHWIETGVGIGLLLAGGVLWRKRHRLAEKDIPDPNAQQKASWLMGATVMAIELPTAFPYFAAIATVLSSGANRAGQVLILLVFNVCFVLPLIAILATLIIARKRAQQILGRGRDFLQRRWPTVGAAMLLLVGLYAVLLGATGFAAMEPGHLARTIRHLRQGLHP
jgi:cytochrome c biogenesis protein CcdA